MRKKLLAVLMAAAMVLSLAACGGDGGSGKDEKSDSSSGGGEGELSGEITVWSWDVALAHLQSQAERFNEKYPDVEFNFEDMSVTQVYQKMTTCLQSGIGLPDIVSLEGEQMQKFGEKFPGQFEEFTDMINKDDFFPIKLAECTVDGKIIAYPWDSGPCAMFYRTDLFEEAEIKAEDIVTWDDFIEAGKKIKEKTGVDMLCMAESRNDQVYRLMLMELGAFYFDEEGTPQVNSPESIQAMEMCKRLYEEDITFNNSSWDDMMTGMASDKFACYPEAVWMVGSIKDGVPDQEGKWKVMPLPKFAKDDEAKGASNGGSVLAVPTASENAEAAKEFVKFCMEDVDANVEGFQNYGLYPSYLPALESEVFKEGDPFFGDQQIFDLFTEIGKTVPQINYTSNFAEALEMSKNCVAQVILEDADPTEVLNAEQKEMESKFGK
ncbi:MAG: sugar ABC transporter substrate-binding protein [Coprococcus sp.]|nr:sugar ABC transporter substrate-binding protein [Coprococcus sp.]